MTSGSDASDRFKGIQGKRSVEMRRLLRMGGAVPGRIRFIDLLLFLLKRQMPRNWAGSDAQLLYDCRVNDVKGFLWPSAMCLQQFCIGLRFWWMTRFIMLCTERLIDFFCSSVNNLEENLNSWKWLSNFTCLQSDEKVRSRVEYWPMRPSRIVHCVTFQGSIFKTSFLLHPIVAPESGDKSSMIGEESSFWIRFWQQLVLIVRFVVVGELGMFHFGLEIAEKVGILSKIVYWRRLVRGPIKLHLPVGWLGKTLNGFPLVWP